MEKIEMEKFWQIMREEMAAQTREITAAVTKNVSESIDGKLTALLEENKNLKNEVNILRDKIKLIDEQKRNNNIIFFGIKEEQRSESPMETVVNVLKKNMGLNITTNEINNAYRLGEKKENKTRPILVSFTTYWRRSEVLKNKKKLDSDIYIKEDLSKETLDKRKQLLPQLKQEREKGKICYFVKDKIVIKEPKEDKREKRKRDSIISPSKSPNGLSSQAPKKFNKTNMLDYVARGRSSSLSALSSTKNAQ